MMEEKVCLLVPNHHLQVPPRGELKLRFLNTSEPAETVTVTMQSLRFDILEATNGAFPSRQFTTTLEARCAVEITVVDRGEPVTAEMVHKYVSAEFREGRIRVSYGDRYRRSDRFNWEDCHVEGEYLEPDGPMDFDADVAVQSYEKVLVMERERETASYRTMREMIRKAHSEQGKKKEEERDKKKRRRRKGRRPSKKSSSTSKESSKEELRRSREELKESREELRRSREELRRSREELRTSKEDAHEPPPRVVRPPPTLDVVQFPNVQVVVEPPPQPPPPPKEAFCAIA